MDVERETVVEAAVSVVAVLLFVVALVAVGASYGGQQLDRTGGVAIVGTIVAFVLLMSAVGVYLDRR